MSVQRDSVSIVDHHFWASLSLRSACHLLRLTLCLSAQAAHLVWSGIAGARQSRQRPAAFASRRFSWAWRRRYSRVLLLCLSYSGGSARFASTSAGEGSDRRFCCAAFGAAFARGLPAERFPLVFRPSLPLLGGRPPAFAGSGSEIVISKIRPTARGGGHHA